MRWITCLAVLCAATLRVSAQPSLTAHDMGRLAVNTTTTLTFTVSGLSITPSFSMRYGKDFLLNGTACSRATPVTCNITVKFTPQYPGLRQDAVLLLGADGTPLAITLLYGIGLGPSAVLRPGVITTFAGTTLGNSGDGGPATAAQLWNPQGIAIDNNGAVYIADSAAQVIRKVDPSGTITTYAGDPGLTSSDSLGDGGPATNAMLNVPIGLALDGAGNLYIADSQNNLVRKVDAFTQSITTVAGNGTASTNLGDGGSATAASLFNPTDVAVDAAGNLYIADQYNNRIRRVDAASGVITTVAGGGSSPGSDGLGDDGAATSAILSGPAAIALDASGNLYIADTLNGGIRVVKNGIISAVAGTTSGTTLNEPSGIRLDAAGNIYIADTNNSVVWEVNAAGMFAVSGQLLQYGFNGDDVLASQAILYTPAGIAIDPAGNLYIADQGNTIIRKIASGPPSLIFPATAIASMSPPQTVSIENIGNQALTFSNVAVTGAFAQQSTGLTDCAVGLSLAPGNSCFAAIAFQPQPTASLTGAFSWQTNAQASAAVLPLSGTGSLPIGPAANAPSLSFGNQPALTPSNSQTITLTNYGTAPLSQPGISITGATSTDFTSTTTCNGSLQPSASCTISVTFTPGAIGTRNATLTLTETPIGANTSANAQLSQAVSLQGIGIAAPALTATSGGSSASFGMVALGASTNVALKFSNASQTAYSISSVAISGTNASQFSSVNGCGSTVAAGASCTVTVSFNPHVAGICTASLVIGGAGPETSVTVALTGTAVGQTTFGGARSGDIRASGDFDGDGISDFVVWRPANGTWYVIPSSQPNSRITQQWGLPGDIPVPADYDRDGKTDFAVWRPSNGTWYVIPSSRPGTPVTQQWGLAGDIPVPGDYDGDGKADFAVWRPGNGTWFVLTLSGASHYPTPSLVQQWGLPGDIPVPGDYDGDGKTDFAVWRPGNGTWYVLTVSGASHYPTPSLVQQWGLPGDMPVPGDYDGDGKTDFTVWRPGNGTWFVLTVSGASHYPNPSAVQQWGLSTDIPVPGDYNGDGKVDFSIWRPGNGTWFVLSSNATGTYPSPSILQRWGLPGDIPR